MNKAIKLFLVVAAVAVSACSGGGSTPHADAVGADTAAPTLISTVPGSGATGVAADTVISAQFSEAMDTSLDASMFTLATAPAGVAVSGTLTVSGDTVTFTPNAKLTAGSQYTATLTTGAKDVAGNALAANQTWSFTVATTTPSTDTIAPTVSSTSPSNDDLLVAPNTLVSVKFSEPMRIASISDKTFTLVPTSGGKAVSGVVVLAGDMATFTPSDPLIANTKYTATVTTGAQDLAGNALAANKIWSFTVATTIPSTDATAPTVSSTSPNNGDQLVALNTLVSVKFSEPMRIASISDKTFTLVPTSGGKAVSGVVVLAGDMATFTPSAPLTASTDYTATVTTGAQDLAGNALAANKTWRFTTGTSVGSTASYQFYRGEKSLYAVNPATPENPLTIEGAADVVANSVRVFLTKTYTAATQTVSNARPYAMVYVKTDGKLYKVSGLINRDLPTPTQLSNESAADKICDVDIYGRNDVDLANPDNSSYVYRTPGPNAICGNNDDVFKLVRLDMGANNAPVIAKAPVIALRNWATGALSGWLVNDAGALKTCDENFKNCSASLHSITSTVKARASVGGTNRYLLEIDNALYMYDGDAQTLSTSPIFSDSGLNIWQTRSDATNFYFVNNGTSKAIYSAPIDGSATATLMITAETEDIHAMFVSGGKIVYATLSAIKTKTVADPVKPTATKTLISGSVILNWLSGNHIYYTTNSTSAIPTAGMIDVDGANQSETAAAAWSGLVFANSFRLDTYDTFDTILRTEGYVSLGAGGTGFGGGALHALNMANPAQHINLGTVPTDILSLDCFSGGWAQSPNVLCQSEDVNSLSDIIFVNTEASNSLARVTSTPAVSEDTSFYYLVDTGRLRPRIFSVGM